MKLTIQTLTGSTFDIQVDKDATMKDVKVSFISGTVPARTWIENVLGPSESWDIY